MQPMDLERLGCTWKADGSLQGHKAETEGQLNLTEFYSTAADIPGMLAVKDFVVNTRTLSRSSRAMRRKE
jgi:hypothetical protein